MLLPAEVAVVFDTALEQFIVPSSAAEVGGICRVDVVKARAVCHADAIVFGGGIGENTSLVLERVCASLRWCGLDMNPETNRTVIDVEGKLTGGSSALQAVVVLTEQGLQIAHECSRAS